MPWGEGGGGVEGRVMEIVELFLAVVPAGYIDRNENVVRECHIMLFNNLIIIIYLNGFSKSSLTLDDV